MTGFPKNCVYVILACCKDLVYNKEAVVTDKNGDAFDGEILPMIVKVGKTDDSYKRFSTLESKMGLSRIEYVLFIKDPPGGVTACERELKDFLRAQNLKVGVCSPSGQFKRRLEMYAADAKTLKLAEKFAKEYDNVDRNSKYISGSRVHDPYDLLDDNDIASPLEITDSITTDHLQILKQYSVIEGVAPPASATALRVLRIYYPDAFPERCVRKGR